MSLIFKYRHFGRKIKTLILALLTIFILIGMITMISLEYNRNFVLGGTYVCKEMPFDFISFEIDGSDEFDYYYDQPSLPDHGTFEKISDGVYLLNSSLFKDEKIQCFKEFPRTNGFHMKINGVNMKFTQTSDVPSEIKYLKK